MLVTFLPNEVADTYDGIDAVVVGRDGFLRTREAASLGAWATLAYQRCHVCRLLLGQYAAWRAAARRPHVDDIYQDHGAHEPDWLKVEAEYDAMMAHASSIGAAFVVAHLPQGGPWTSAEAYPAHRLSAWAERRGAGFVDLLPAMAEHAGRERLYYERDGHATAAGHAVIADVLTAYLTTRYATRLSTSDGLASPP